jgi:hypothetical protein
MIYVPPEIKRLDDAWMKRMQAAQGRRTGGADTAVFKGRSREEVDRKIEQARQ